MAISTGSLLDKEARKSRVPQVLPDSPICVLQMGAAQLVGKLRNLPTRTPRARTVPRRNGRRCRCGRVFFFGFLSGLRDLGGEMLAYPLCPHFHFKWDRQGYAQVWYKMGKTEE